MVTLASTIVDARVTIFDLEIDIFRLKAKRGRLRKEAKTRKSREIEAFNRERDLIFWGGNDF